jgi:hypothetical protein
MQIYTPVEYSSFGSMTIRPLHLIISIVRMQIYTPVLNTVVVESTSYIYLVRMQIYTPVLNTVVLEV